MADIKTETEDSEDLNGSICEDDQTKTSEDGVEGTNKDIKTESCGDDSEDLIAEDLLDTKMEPSTDNSDTKPDHPERPFKCVLCPKSFKSKKDINGHISCVHPDENKRVFACTECDYTSVRTGHFIEHMRRHTGEKPHKCTVEASLVIFSNAEIGMRN